ncbi:MAG: YhfX family PLP-dependent enzyme [Breznakia sp.]
MFLNKTLRSNPLLIKTSFALHQEGKILPDTYVVDVDTFKENAGRMLEEAKKQNIELYFMLKQLGRNPYLAKVLIDMGYEGAVVVDFREALVMKKHSIPISNIGHLVQTPKTLLKEFIEYGCKYFTVFSFEKAKEINDICKKLNSKQKLLLKVVDVNDYLYSGQESGIKLKDLEQFINKTKNLKHIEIAGVTSFPCFLYDYDKQKINETNNMNTLLKAKKILKRNGIYIENLNAPSTTCVHILKQLRNYGVTSGEPGHGLTGSTPLHAVIEGEEIPCVTYVSEISHNFDGKGYCYGGGHYRRSHVEEALIGTSINNAKTDAVIPPATESIDYYFGLRNTHKVSESVIMAFRFQIFVTRSNIAIIEGIQNGNPEVVSLYTSLGDEINE